MDQILLRSATQHNNDKVFQISVCRNDQEDSITAVEEGINLKSFQAAEKGMWHLELR